MRSPASSCHHYLKQLHYPRGSPRATFLLQIQSNREILSQVISELMHFRAWKKMKLLFPFCSFLSVFYHFLSLPASDSNVSIEPSLLRLCWVALSPLLRSIPLLSNLLISQSVCSSLCNSATLCQSMLMRRQHMAHSLFKLSRQTDCKPLNSPSIPSPYLPLLDRTTLIS